VSTKWNERRDFLAEQAEISRSAQYFALPSNICVPHWATGPSGDEKQHFGVYIAVKFSNGLMVLLTRPARSKLTRGALSLSRTTGPRPSVAEATRSPILVAGPCAARRESRPPRHARPIPGAPPLPHARPATRRLAHRQWPPLLPPTPVATSVSRARACRHAEAAARATTTTAPTGVPLPSTRLRSARVWRCPPLRTRSSPATFPRRLGRATSRSGPHRRGQGRGALAHSRSASPAVHFAHRAVQRAGQPPSMCLRPPATSADWARERHFTERPVRTRQFKPPRLNLSREPLFRKPSPAYRVPFA
jgi:hypothetical protein